MEDGLVDIAHTILEAFLDITNLRNSLSQSTELATAPQNNQSPTVRPAVPKACCKNGR
jgi:hypothetical protein